MPTPDAVREALQPLVKTLSTLDLSSPDAAERAVEAAHPYAGLAGLGALLFAARDEGWLTPKRATADLTFGRLAKAGPQTEGFSIDVVDMSGAGAEHVHPNGEISLCFAERGDPRFVGRAAGWVIVPPESRHVPEVTGGRMLIAYFLPDGAITFV